MKKLLLTLFSFIASLTSLIIAFNSYADGDTKTFNSLNNSNLQEKDSTNNQAPSDQKCPLSDTKSETDLNSNSSGTITSPTSTKEDNKDSSSTDANSAPVNDHDKDNQQPYTDIGDDDDDDDDDDEEDDENTDSTSTNISDTPELPNTDTNTVPKNTK